MLEVSGLGGDTLLFSFFLFAALGQLPEGTYRDVLGIELALPPCFAPPAQAVLYMAAGLRVQTGTSTSTSV